MNFSHSRQLITGIVAGFVLGILVGWLLIGWLVWPVAWENARLSDLSAAGKAHYLSAVSDAYVAYSSDTAAAIASARLAGWGDDLPQSFEDAKDYFAQNQPPDHTVRIYNLNQLAAKLNLTQPSPDGTALDTDLSPTAAPPNPTAVGRPPISVTSTETLPAPPSYQTAIRSVNWSLGVLTLLALIGGGIYIFRRLTGPEGAALNEAIYDEIDPFDDWDAPSSADELEHERLHSPAPYRRSSKRAGGATQPTVSPSDSFVSTVGQPRTEPEPTIPPISPHQHSNHDAPDLESYPFDPELEDEGENGPMSRMRSPIEASGLDQDRAAAENITESDARGSDENQPAELSDAALPEVELSYELDLDSEILDGEWRHPPEEPSPSTTEHLAAEDPPSQAPIVQRDDPTKGKKQASTPSAARTDEAPSSSMGAMSTAATNLQAPSGVRISSMTAHYQVGMVDDEESQALIDPKKEVYIGEYGLGINTKYGVPPDNADYVMILDVWLFDKSDDTSPITQTAVLLSDYATEQKMQNIVRVDNGRRQQLIVPELGAKFQLQGKNILLDCEITELLMLGAEPVPGVFEEIKVRMTAYLLE